MCQLLCCLCRFRQLSDFIKIILICVLKMKDVFGVIIDRIWISCILQCKHIMMVCFLHFQLYFWKWWSKKTLFCLSILLDAHFSTEFVPTLIQISEIWNISKCESFFQTKLSSPPVAGVWWAHCAVFLWQLSHHPSGCCTLVVIEERHPPPPHDCKALWVYNNTQ